MEMVADGPSGGGGGGGSGNPLQYSLGGKDMSVLWL